MVGTADARSARRAGIALLSVLVLFLVAGALYWFQPWKLWTDHVVDESLPTIAAVEFARGPSGNPSARTSTRPNTVPGTVQTSQAVLLADGELISHQHPTTGAVELIRLANGHRALTLENLRTSNGPALRVWLVDSPVVPGSAGWDVFDDGAHLDLGDLKGNIGNQIYPVGDDVDLSRYSGITIWCERFSVSFGAAELYAA